MPFAFPPLALTRGPRRRRRRRDRARFRTEALEDRRLLSITELPVPTGRSGPFGIAAGPDGNLWFTEFNAGRIATINPVTHAIVE